MSTAPNLSQVAEIDHRFTKVRSKSTKTTDRIQKYCARPIGWACAPVGPGCSEGDTVANMVHLSPSTDWQTSFTSLAADAGDVYDLS